MDLQLAGHVVLITGASRGIGAATAARVADEGAHVVGVARDEGSLRGTLDALPGGPHVAVAGDATTEATAVAAVARAEEAFGRLDAVVCAAGATDRIPMAVLTDTDWEAQLALCVLGPMRLVRAASELLATRPGAGRVVHVGSSSGKRSSATNVAYSVGKTAQLALSRAQAEDLAPRGVRVGAVTPGPLDGEIWLRDGGLADQLAAEAGTSRADVLAAKRAGVPLGRFGTPGEVADVVALLASPRAGFATGGAWSVDGGVAPTIL